MSGDTRLGEFETHRPHLHAVAYRMLGSLAEADDAVQETWLRAERSSLAGIDNLAAWLTTVVARVCLNVLRSRDRERPLDAHVPDPIVTLDPEHEAVLADTVGLALMVVLDTLGPTERLAFVLHDLFAVPFEAIAPIVDRTPAAVRQAASRARRRVREQAPAPDPDLARQRQVVDAFFAASRDGDFDALVAVLDPDVVLRSDGGTGRQRLTMLLSGARAVAGHAVEGRRWALLARPALVNDTAGVVVAANGVPLCVMAFTVINGRITRIDAIVDPDRLPPLVPASG